MCERKGKELLVQETFLKGLLHLETMLKNQKPEKKEPELMHMWGNLQGNLVIHYQFTMHIS